MPPPITAVQPIDANWMTPLWNESALDYKNWWPVKVPTHFQVPQVEAAIDTSLTGASGQHIYVDQGHNGFFITRPGLLPEKEIVCPELVIWICRRGLPPKDYFELVGALMYMRCADELKRLGETWTFGSMPETMPAGDRAYLDAWVATGDVERVVYDGLGGAKWQRLYGYVTKDAVKRIPR